MFIQPIHYDSIVPNVLNNDNELIFETLDTKVTIRTDELHKDELERLKPFVIADIELKERSVDLKIRETKKEVVKENDSPVKNFFTILGIISLVLFVLYIVLKVIRK